VTIASASLLVYAVSSTPLEATPTELLMLVLAAACIGFLPHNFHPASIFMGDAGSMLLGLLLASGTVLGFSRTDEPRFVDVAGFVVPVLLPVLVLAIPLADAVLAVFRRVKGGRSVFHGDKEHLHHRLFDMAKNHRTAVGIIYLWSALVASATVSLAILPGLPGRITAVAFTVALVASIFIVPRRLRRGSPLEKSFTNSGPSEVESASD
jgi:UDP-GlcNAc:undecaprenyl-phosphate/decaprenyl-phosphate GlcNAc-1-phosphate transferase